MMLFSGAVSNEPNVFTWALCVYVKILTLVVAGSFQIHWEETP